MVTPCTPFPNVLLKRRTCDAFFSLFFKISKKSNIKNRIFDCWLSDVSKTSMLRAQKKRKRCCTLPHGFVRAPAGLRVDPFEILRVGWNEKGSFAQQNGLRLGSGCVFSPFFICEPLILKCCLFGPWTNPFSVKTLGLTQFCSVFFSSFSLFILFSWSRFVPAGFSYPYFLTVLCWWIVRPLVDQEGEEHIVRMILYFFFLSF